MPSLNKNTTLQRLYCVTGLFLLSFIFFELLENTQNSTFPKILLAIHLRRIFRNSNVYNKCIISLLSSWNSCTNEIKELTGIKIESDNKTFSEKHSRAYQTLRWNLFLKTVTCLKLLKIDRVANLTLILELFSARIRLSF